MASRVENVKIWCGIMIFALPFGLLHIQKGQDLGHDNILTPLRMPLLKSNRSKCLFTYRHSVFLVAYKFTIESIIFQARAKSKTK